ncbi:phosphodiester glycosidase family protein [Candidatus Synechococcus spongiarum]|uniref:phosphodiester glycosidase family protein n=1 Tax=Candidatus Synechococcus spongiarum TaxID=431041 RepID=UPI0015D663D3|nr:phosphodiester glycosidase family protein [Candidatus Synechococcus spongiarum]
MPAAVGRFAALSLLSSLSFGLFAPAHGGQSPTAPAAPSPLPAEHTELFRAEALPATLPPLQQPQGGQTGSPVVTGDTVVLNGAELQAPWRLEGESGSSQRLFVPTDVLIHRLGAKVSPGPGGRQLVWFGHVVPLEETPSSLEGVPALDITPLVQRFRWRFRPVASRLNLQVPPPQLINVRLWQSAERVRIVLDFLGPAPFRLQDGVLLVEMRSRDLHLREMETLGIPHQWTPGLLRLNTAALGPDRRILTLGRPERLVLDLSYEDFLALRIPGPTKQDVLPPLEQFQLTTRVMALGARKFRLHSVALDVTNPAVTMLPLTSSAGMDGLNPLRALAKGWQADLAINGGYFNRIRKLPLGAIKREGQWLSGPILGRGAIGWRSGERPVFGRLVMQETVTGPGGFFPISHLNSGYVQKGVARYTHRWGSHYLPLTQGETGILVQGNRVVRHFASFQLDGGVALAPESWLLVARYGATLPLRLGDYVELDQRLTPGVFGRQPHVLGAGPLLLQGGRIVLNVGLERFSSQFQRQKAPRSVVAWGQGQLWLLTVQGLGNSGPDLKETAQLVQRLGMEDALNLDGGSSTTLVFRGVTAVRGRGVDSRVHNGLGVMVRQPPGENGS